MTLRVAIRAALLLTTAALLGACASSTTTNGAGSTSSSSVPTSLPTSLPTSVPTQPPSSSSTSSSSSSSARSPSSPSSPPTTSNAPSGPAACTFAQLSITLVRGGSSPHTQLAGLIFTNRSSRTCGLHGYPFAQLVLNGKTLGSPARHIAGSVQTVTLSAGASAEADLTATTTCNAPLSDHVRVSAPGQTTTVDLADTLRNCVLSVAPVSPSS